MISDPTTKSEKASVDSTDSRRKSDSSSSGRLPRVHPATRLANRLKVFAVPARVLGHFLVAPFRRILVPRIRDTWHPNFETMVTIMRSILLDTPEDVEVARMLADRTVPGIMLPRGVHRFKERIVTTDSARIKCEWLWPRTRTPSIHPRRLANVLPPSFSEVLTARPVVLFIHGGGFSMCNTGSHRALLAQLALYCDTAVYAPNYRRAPEHAIEESVADVLACVKRLESEYAVSPDRIVIAGDSAGGNLAYLTLLEMKRLKWTLPKCAVLLCPWMDLTDPGDQENALFDYLPLSRIAYFARLGAGDYPTNDPRVSPIFADLTGMPPTLVHAGECEVLLSSIKRFSDVAMRQGVRVDFKVWRDMIHVFHTFAFSHETARAAIDDIRAFIDAQFGIGRMEMVDRTTEVLTTSELRAEEHPSIVHAVKASIVVENVEYSPDVSEDDEPDEAYSDEDNGVK